MAIHQFEGYVAVTDEMIGFTTEGKVKVWLNSCFGLNHANNQKGEFAGMGSEEQAERMIWEVMRVVEGHTVGGRLPEGLWSRVED